MPPGGSSKRICAAVLLAIVEGNNGHGVLHDGNDPATGVVSILYNHHTQLTSTICTLKPPSGIYPGSS